MRWEKTLARLGFDPGTPPGVIDGLLTASLVAGLIWLGWLVRARLMPRLLSELPGKLERPESAIGRFLGIFAQYGVIIIGLLLARQLLESGPIGFAILATSLALACGLFAHALVRATHVAGTLLALVVGAAVLALVAAAAFGGAAALMTTLDDVGFSAGTYRVSLLSGLTMAAVGIGIYLAASFAISLVNGAIERATDFDPSQQLLAQKLAAIVITVVAVLLGIDSLGISLTSLAVFSGALGLAVGFGLQKTLGNLIAGLILLIDRSIKPGDVIVVGDTFGWVDKIGVRAVSIVTRDGKEHLIPNEKLMTEPVENWSHSSKQVRVHVPVGVSYQADMKLAQELMVQAADACPRVIKELPTNVWMTGYGSSSVDFEILVWISDPEQGVGNVRSEILNRLWWLFKEHQVEIPFPQLDLHIRSNAAGLGKPPADQQ